MLQLFFPYYGSKFTLARLYGRPKYSHVVEPFAGAAAYSCYHEPEQVTIVEVNPVIYGVLKYLQSTSPAEILKLPTDISRVDQLPPEVCEEARNWIGFWLNCWVAVPALSRSPWAKNPNKLGSYWSETTKYRIANQVHRIRHWNIIWGSYEEAPDIEAHWFIDPPYGNAAGRHYPYHEIDHPALANWCKSRRGFVQVCGNDGETWLPFRPLKILNTHRPRGYSVEAVCEIDNQRRRGAK